MEDGEEEEEEQFDREGLYRTMANSAAPTPPPQSTLTELSSERRMRTATYFSHTNQGRR